MNSESLAQRFPEAYAWAFLGDNPARNTMSDPELARILKKKTGYSWSLHYIRREASRLGLKKLNVSPPTVIAGNTIANHTVTSAKIAPAAVVVSGDVLSVTGNEDAPISDLDQMILDAGLNPDDWEVKNLTLNKWPVSRYNDETEEWDVHESFQVKATYEKKIHYRLLLPSPVELKTRYTVGVKQPTGARLILITSDPQIPFHDERLHQLSCGFAHDNQVSEWIELGDFLDLPLMSKYRKRPEWSASLQESIDTGCRILKERAEAVPEARKRKIPGNHDQRAINWILDNAPELFGVRRAQIGPPENYAVLDPDYLMRSEEVGWEVVGQEYPHTEVEILPDLIGIHGNFVRAGATNSVKQELIRRDHSVAQGHVNKLGVAAWVRYRKDGSPFMVWGIETGMMGRVDGGMGFGGTTPDWCQGFVVIVVAEDGSWTPEVVPYVNNALSWRGKVYR